ncbi:MAG: PAS domain-containing protein [Proteobacteria bacterium]|nr:PAS domain-containing protein [Pseudomonadota bacterium]MBU0965103.1 PAS domain-containing protein [Pseudomonadota bacterium]
MNWLFPSIIASLCGTIILTATYFYLYSIDRNRSLAIWGAGWGVYALRFIFMLLFISEPFGNYHSPLLIANQLAVFVSGMILLWGTFTFFGIRMPRFWLPISCLIVPWIIWSGSAGLPFLLVSLPTYCFLGAVYLWTGIVFLKNLKTTGTSREITGWAFIIWGIHKADYPFLRPVIWFAPWGYMLGAILEIVVAIGMLLIYFQTTREALSKSEQRYAKAQKAANIGSWELDVHHDQLSFSAQVAPIFGLAGHPPITTFSSFSECIHPEDRNLVTTGFQAAINDNKELNLEHRIIWPDGSVHWIAESGDVLRDDTGKAVSVTGIMLDITERKIAANQTQKAFEQFQTITDSLDAFVYVADMDNYELLFLNKYGREIFGEVVGKKCWEVLQKGQTGPCPFCTNDRLFDPDGSPAEPYVWELCNTVDQQWYECRDQAIKWPDGRTVRMEIATDITARKRLEEELFQARKMEAIGTLAGGIAHDFNNILTAILGYAELAKTDIANEKQTREDLDEVIIGTKRARDLIKQILTFCRKSTHQLEPLAPYLIIKESLKLLRSSQPSSMEIRPNIDAGCGKILADPTKIQQILVNLCTNARQAMENEQGLLTVSLLRQELTDDEVGPGMSAGPFIELMVADTGHGMDKETEKRIFEPFFTTKGIRNTGMGLAMVHGIVQDYHGMIKVDSEVGKGTVFRIYFPAITENKAEEKDKAQQQLPIPGGNEHILVVDDESVIVRMLKTTLEKLGYRVTGKTSSLEALEEFRSTPGNFDLIITDQTMPALSGTGLAQEALQIRPAMPIILCIGYNSLISEEDVKKMGIRAFAMKPLDSIKLARLIRDALD